MATFTLHDSSKNYKHIQVLIYTPSAENLIECIYREAVKKMASNRLVIKDGKYMYTPSDEYTSMKGKPTSKFIRFKNFKK